MQEKKALGSRGRGRLRGFLELRRPWEGMANNSSILAWKIPWTEVPSGLYSPWSHKETRLSARARARTHPAPPLLTRFP